MKKKGPIPDPQSLTKFPNHSTWLPLRPMPPLHGPQGYAFAELVLAFPENLALAQRTLASGTMTALVTLFYCNRTSRSLTNNHTSHKVMNNSHPSEEPNLMHASRQPNLSLAAQEPNFSPSSPSLGRGRGMRQSPRKTFSHASRQANFSSQEPSQQPYGLQHSQQPYFSQPSLQPYTKTIDRAKWTSPLIKSLLEACAEGIEENGRAVNGFSKQAWARIVNAVMGKTGKKLEKKQLKDKHDRLKDEWRAWILVAEDKRQNGSW
ncbi:hypothetical protein RHSIM_Rhsim03G0199100 [Rhododendron simsii]|uniref:Myb/SANT-like domain-containing protein n=1 Tax=Rhododendron simsii TaxID=118357 RepID=A0A834H7D9_RHOSS|nr:hypothetical protein RHSIM_Rhsim03G0199100 [Rhododendron simsii]